MSSNVKCRLSAEHGAVSHAASDLRHGDGILQCSVHLLSYSNGTLREHTMIDDL